MPVDTPDRFVIIPPRLKRVLHQQLPPSDLRREHRRGVFTMAWLDNRSWVEDEQRPLYNQDEDEDIDEEDDDDFDDDDDLDDDDLDDEDDDDEDDEDD